MRNLSTFLRRSLFLSILFFATQFVQAQEDKKDNQTVVIPCSEFHVTRPLSELAAEGLLLVKPQKIGESKDRENRVPQKFPLADGKSPVYGNNRSIMQDFMGKGAWKAPLTNWAGQYAAGCHPWRPCARICPLRCGPLA